jgi:hypothetical protein
MRVDVAKGPKLDKWRAEARTELIKIHHALIDAGLWSGADAAAAQTGDKWLATWRHGGGCQVSLTDPALMTFIARATGANPQDWLEALNIWTPERPA